MMRSIIRFSINRDPGSKLTNKLRKILEKGDYKLKKGKTATYENPEISEQELAELMLKFWEQAGKPVGQAEIDHVWTYADLPL